MCQKGCFSLKINFYDESMSIVQDEEMKINSISSKIGNVLKTKKDDVVGTRKKSRVKEIANYQYNSSRRLYCVYFFILTIFSY